MVSLEGSKDIGKEHSHNKAFSGPVAVAA